MPDHAIIYDCEFLVSDGAMQRFWNGPRDPDPQVVQIGACKLALTPPYDIIDTFVAYISPIDRTGAPVLLDDLFTRLTGIAQETIDADGQPYPVAMDAFDTFSHGAQFWSWGKDELNLLGTAALIHGIAPPIPAARFANACDLLLAAGVPYDTVTGLRSHTMLAHFGLTAAAGRAYDALADSSQVTHVLQHLLTTGDLCPSDFT
jgi:hypothetical protein